MKLIRHPDRKRLAAAHRAEDYPMTVVAQLFQIFREDGPEHGATQRVAVEGKMPADLGKALFLLNSLLLGDIRPQLRELFGPGDFTCPSKYQRASCWILQCDSVSFYIYSAASRGTSYEVAVAEHGLYQLPAATNAIMGAALLELAERLTATPAGQAKFALLKQQLGLPATLTLASQLELARTALPQA